MKAGERAGKGRERGKQSCREDGEEMSERRACENVNPRARKVDSSPLRIGLVVNVRMRRLIKSTAC